MSALPRLFSLRMRFGEVNHGWRETGSSSGRFSRALDDLEEQLVLLDLTGQVIHESAALSRRLETEPAAEALRFRIRELVLGLDGASDAEHARHNGKRELAVQEVQLASGQYRLCGRFLSVVPSAPETLVLVTLRRLTPEPITLESLQARFPLTCREARVALLLAERRSNEEIACELGISLHTARHHTEHVLRKLGAHSRKEVAALLLGE